MNYSYIVEHSGNFIFGDEFSAIKATHIPKRCDTVVRRPTYKVLTTSPVTLV